MNLTKMRLVGWNDIVYKAYENYSALYDVNMDQLLLNYILYYERGYKIILRFQRFNMMYDWLILLIYNLAMLMEIPCHFNYLYTHCDKDGHGQLCQSAEKDPDGIHIVHGTGQQYILKRSSMYPIHKYYSKVSSDPFSYGFFIVRFIVCLFICISNSKIYHSHLDFQFNMSSRNIWKGLMEPVLRSYENRSKFIPGCPQHLYRLLFKRFAEPNGAYLLEFNWPLLTFMLTSFVLSCYEI